MKNAITFLFIISLIFSSCEKSLELELKDEGGNLVLFSFLTPDSMFNVHLSKSVSIFSIDDFERVYDGNITVYKNGKMVDDFIFPFEEKWAYRENITFTYGDTLQIEAFDSEGHYASGQTIIPDPVPMVVNTRKVVGSEYGSPVDTVLECKIRISDPGTAENYYQLLIYEDICVFEEDDSVCTRNKIDYSKTDPVFYVRDQEESLIGSLDFDGCFSDYLFDGEEYEITIYIPNQYILSSDSSFSHRRILFFLLSHTRQYYDYFRSRIIAEYGYDLPLLDPIRIYNNVDGGLGVVSGYAIYSYTLNLN